MLTKRDFERPQDSRKIINLTAVFPAFLPLRVHPVDRQRDVGVPPLDLDGVPLEVVQSEVARAAQLGLPSAEVDVHLRKERECMDGTANHLFVNFGTRLSPECLSGKKM